MALFSFYYRLWREKDDICIHIYIYVYSIEMTLLFTGLTCLLFWMPFQGQGRHYLPKPWRGLLMFLLLLQMQLHWPRQVCDNHLFTMVIFYDLCLLWFYFIFMWILFKDWVSLTRIICFITFFRLCCLLIYVKFGH